MEGFLKAVTFVAGIVCIISACCLDSDNTMFFLVVMLVSLAWLLWYAWYKDLLY